MGKRYRIRTKIFKAHKLTFNDISTIAQIPQSHSYILPSQILTKSSQHLPPRTPKSAHS
ncbi:hypothetical protein GQ55_4G058800 [Panicum hallii var. hallii]|uniref:Uncharacterized protein n=1 Tax=Panicum hallii var. hallii TaxID=1504633 RepID=A0A2T7DVN6_9POAL|nr:hypothetical protein GQ55_4G058800 [Panicum hallii var. hallii]